MTAILRKIPSVDKILSEREIEKLTEKFGKDPVTSAVRESLQELRQKLLGKTIDETKLEELVAAKSIIKKIEELLDTKAKPTLCRVINATGIILHTGLGRAPLAKSAIEAIVTHQSSYSLLEVDRASGDRGIRENNVISLLAEVTGAESATVVNNNASAVLISLATFAKGKEVIVSRGQLVEIGGSFRIPEVMEASGAKLVEVGTTNKTYMHDYEKKINEHTTALLRVHTSNFRMLGFTHSAQIEDLVALGRKHKVLVMDDLGSGALLDLTRWGIKDEPLVQDSVKAGVDIITFSGDKLLGGPQAGIILGKKEIIKKIRSNPLFRAMRIDKLTLTALEATLKLFLDKETLFKRHPTLKMITEPLSSLENGAKELADKLKGIKNISVALLDDNSEVGGGSVPALNLPTKVVAIKHKAFSPDQLSAKLRENYPPIFARIKEQRTLFDVRTLTDGDGEEIARFLNTL